MKFQKDKSCKDLPLRDTFPNLFSIASSKDAWVVDVWDGGSWNPRFFKQLNDWELKEVHNFFWRLHDQFLSLDSKDTLV